MQQADDVSGETDECDIFRDAGNRPGDFLADSNVAVELKTANGAVEDRHVECARTVGSWPATVRERGRRQMASRFTIFVIFILFLDIPGSREPV